MGLFETIDVVLHLPKIIEIDYRSFFVITFGYQIPVANAGGDGSSTSGTIGFDVEFFFLPFWDFGLAIYEPIVLKICLLDFAVLLIILDSFSNSLVLFVIALTKASY